MPHGPPRILETPPRLQDVSLPQGTGFCEDPLVCTPIVSKRLSKPRGRRIQRALGELVTCSRCVGAWSALGVVGLRAASPAAGRLVTSILATSALNDWAQAGFAWLRGRANQPLR